MALFTFISENRGLLGVFSAMAYTLLCNDMIKEKCKQCRSTKIKSGILFQALITRVYGTFIILNDNLKKKVVILSRAFII
jgi:hypothetical protein